MIMIIIIKRLILTMWIDFARYTEVWQWTVRWDWVSSWRWFIQDNWCGISLPRCRWYAWLQFWWVSWRLSGKSSRRGWLPSHFSYILSPLHWCWFWTIFLDGNNIMWIHVDPISSNNTSFLPPSPIPAPGFGFGWGFTKRKGTHFHLLWP